MLKSLNLEKLKKLFEKNIVVLSSVAISVTSINASANYKEVSKKSAENLFNDNSVNLYLSDVTTEDLYNLSSSVKQLNINYSYFIDSLDMIPLVCPNIESITINYCPLISDFSFVKECKNLKQFNVNNTAFVTEELVDYLNDNNIQHNINVEDVMLSKKIDDIYKRVIIGEGLSNKEKIRDITLYIINNFEYDMDYYTISNRKPLDSFLESHRGVCTSYAYLVSTLLTKAGIENYEVRNEEHIWNLVKNDGKYYYLDVANLDDNNMEFFVKNTDNYMYFMSDPNVDFGSSMSAYTKDDVILPDSIIKDIDDTEKYKNFDEKYCTGYISYYLKYLICMGIGCGLIKMECKQKRKRLKKSLE